MSDSIPEEESQQQETPETVLPNEEDEEALDNWDTEEEKPPEDSDEVLLAEILAEEEAEIEAEKVRLEAEEAARKAAGIKAGPIPGQLSAFQQTIITTGSGVGYSLLVVLSILFVIKCMEHIYNFFQRRTKLAKVRKALDMTKHTSIEDYTSNDPDRLKYVKYDSEFSVGQEMDARIREGFRDRNALRLMLQERALEVVKRRFLLMREEQSVHRGYQMDLVPLEVWNDFLSAKEHLGQELMKLQILCDKMQVNYKDLINQSAMRYHTMKNSGASKKQKVSALLRQRRLAKSKQARKSPSVPKANKDEPPKSEEQSRSPSEPTAVSTADGGEGELRRRRVKRGRMRFGKKTTQS